MREKQPELAERRRAFELLRGQAPDAKVDFHPITGSPRWLRRERGYLSQPAGVGGQSAKPSTGSWQEEAHRIAKGFVEDHAALFGHRAEVLDAAQLKREFLTPHNGLKTVIWEQQLDGLRVFEAVFIAHVTKDGELVSISSSLVADPKRAADFGMPNRARLQLNPPIAAAAAVAVAGREVGETPRKRPLDRRQGPPHPGPLPFGRGEGEPSAAFGAANAADYPVGASTALVWLPMSAEQLRLCWEVVLTSRSRGEMFRVLVDAETGKPLVRHCLTSYLSDATYRVYTSDSPSPFSPGYATPTSIQPPVVSRALVTLSAFDTNASPSGWIADTNNETRGNNVDAHTDRNNDDQPDLPRPQGSPARVFDFAMDLSGQDPTNYSSAATVQLFYWCNWMHDRLYQLGFTEAAGNFQNDNFGRGGVGNDALQADAQDGSGVNNANFSVWYDGSAPRMQMYLFDGPSPRRDGDLDAEVILHEYTHGLSNRRVGGGTLITALQTAGMGEGWSDFYALALLSEASDDVNGTYPMGAYASYQLDGLTQNYYFGIRRYPYCTDLAKNPLTFKDIDPAQASAHSGVPKNPVIGGSPSEVHSQGEVWCVALWEARAKLIQKYGWPAGNQLALQLVTDGMNLSPPNPNFLEARDAILQANLVDNGGLDLNELWAAFAKRGMGYSASSPASSTTSGVIEAFNLPADPLSLLPTGGLSSSGKLGGPFFPATETFTLINLGTNPLNWTAGTTVPWLGLSASAGGLPTQNSSTTVTAFFNSAANALPKGIYSGALRFTNTSSGAIFTRSAKLVVGRSVVAWGDTSRGANEPDSVFDVVAVACGSYDTLCLKRDGTVFGWGANYDGQTNVPPGLSNVAAISMGVSHSLALKSDGTVSAWGSDYRTQTEIPADLANVIGIAAGGYHSLALRCDGTLTAWGAGKTVAYPSDGLNYGQAIVPAGLSNVVAIAAGWGHSLALKADGTVAGWGANYYGQSSVPFGLNNVVAIAAGEDHSLALKADGSVVAWGVNYDGETTIPPGLANVAAVAAGGSHSLALVTNGTVTAWGFDAYGEVEVPTGLSNVVAVAAGWYHSVALLNDGTLSSPFIYQQPHDCVSLVGKSVVFNVGAVGTPALQYQWTKGGVTLSNGKNVSGVNSSTLVLYAVAEADEGSYAVIITNPNGSVTSSNAFLTVLDPGIATQPAGSTNLYGTTASFSVIASGSSPLRYQWRKNGTDLVNGGNISGATTPTLTVSSVQPSDAASYTVLVRNHKGSIVSVVAYLRVITTPEITRQPLSRNKWMGQNVSLTMSGRGATPLNYRWLKDATGAPLSEPARFLTDGGKISGATTPTLTLSNLSFPEAGDYQAVLSNVWGSVTSAPAHLAVSTARGHVVAWGGNDYGQTNVPSGLTNVVMIDAGGYHSMALKSDGTVVEWGDSQWIPASQNNVAALDGSQGLDLILKGDGTIGAWGWSFFGETNIPAGLSNVVAVSAGYNFSVALKDDGTVAAWGGNPGGMGNYLGQLSDVVAISAGDDHLLALKRDGTVTALGEDFIGQTEVPAGLTNVVAVAAGGKHSLALKADATVIAWGANYYGQANVPAGLSNVVAIAAGLGNSMAVKSDGTVVNWGTGDQGLNLTPPSWLSNVTAAAGAYAHGLALVNDLLPPAIAVAAASRTNNASVTATFTVTATGAAPLAYQWKRNGANMVDGGNISGANSSALSLANVLKATEGSYSVLVSNIAGLALSADAVLTVLDPAITSLPTSRTNLAGTTATFSASVSGTPALNLQWLKNGVKLVDGGKVSGAGTTNLALSAVDQTDAASYSVVVSNVIGSVTSSPPAVLVVIDPPAITAQPASRTNIAGSSASFSVGAGGTGPLRYQWRKDGGNLPNGGKISGATTATLLITTVAQTEAASYSVVITNLGGSVTSSPPALLTVLDPPAITSQPASRTNIAGTTATFGVAAIGTAPLSFQWLKNGVKMVEGGRIFGTAGTNLTVTSVDQTDAGSYAVVVTNAAGSITSSPSAVLTVIDPPAISAQPLSRTNLARSTVTFAITASGSAPLSYQWQKEGAPLTNGGRVLGATSSALTLASLVKADQGNYRAVVTNLGGSVTSAEARLTVLDAVYAFTRFATEVGPASARLNGMVDPVGSAASAWFEWGTNTSYGHSTSPQDVGAGQSVVYFSFVLGGLGHGAIIHYRSVASNDTQVLYGPDQQFITGGRARAWGDDSSGQVSIPAGVSDVTDVAGGLSHSLARRTDASVTGWGNNTYGQGLIPAAATNVAAITAGGFHNLALLTNGTVLGWGRSDFGQATAPTGLSNVVALAAGGSHSLALRGDGSIAAWGYNAQGQTTLPVGLSNVVGLAAGWYHSLALRSDGTVQAWGNNTYGQCSVPAGLTNVVWIGAGLYHSLALRRDGTMAAWGYNGSGQTSLPADLTNVVAAACGGYHNLALRSDASLLGWGYNFYGQATPPADATNFVVLAAGGSHSLAIAPSLPLPAAPVLSVALSHWNTNGFDLRFTGASNATYRVWASTNFLNWTPLGTAQSLGTGWFDYLDSTATNWPRRFYKAGAP